jgi:uncharacterized caspase-like protein
MPEDLNRPEESSRGLQVALPISEAVNIERWAVVIGISDHKHKSLNLKYAARDAEEFYNLLISPVGGSFEPDHVVKLIDQQATTDNINEALRIFLAKPGKDDLLIFYCACHGSPDFNSSNAKDVYLITHDTDPNKIAVKGLPMKHINDALKATRPKRIVVFADTCYSAAIAGDDDRRDLQQPNGQINNYYKEELSTAKEGIALLTSSEANQTSQENEKWGGGHGVFTYYLLKGLEGDADSNKNGLVTVGELFEYVRSNVQIATGHTQHPSIGTSAYDRNLPLAVFGQVSTPLAGNSDNSQAVNRQTHDRPGIQPNEPTGNRLPKTILWGACAGIPIIGYLILKLSSPVPSPTDNPQPVASKPSPLPTLSKAGLEICHYPQGDKKIVLEALAPLSSRVKSCSSNLEPTPRTNAVWYGSQVPIKDVRLVATQLRQANVMIQSIQPFQNSDTKQLIIDVGADRTISEKQPVLTLEDIRNGVFKRRSNSS